MLGVLFLLIFLASGLYLVHRTLHHTGLLERIWIGLAFGFMLAMVLPAIYAFAFRFSITAQIAAAVTVLLFDLLALRFGSANMLILDENRSTRNTALALLLPFALLAAYLQYTHNIRVGLDGSYYVGQSTYGDLPLHLSIITSARDAVFPMDYSIFPGFRLSYPFLIDTLSTSLYMLGLPLAWSVSLPGTLSCVLIFYGYFLLANKIAHRQSAAVLAFLFLFINGGLGFLYHFDLSGGDFGKIFSNILEGFYKTPTNQPDPYNLRWSNLIADLLIPQRTFMGGWLLLLPCLYLLLAPFLENRLHSKAELLILILMAGFLPMVNTHAFLALGIFSLGQMLFQAFFGEKTHRKRRLLHFCVFGAGTLALALPQLFTWTFQQALGTERFLKFHFNWVNNQNGKLIDSYFWFYLKNIGILFVPVVLSLFHKDKAQRAIVWSAFLIFVVAELVVFQPNHYDNNKIFYVWYALCLPVACDALMELYHHIRSHYFAKPLAVLTLFLCLWSGTLSLMREVVSNYRQFDADLVAAASFTEKNTAKDSRFLTGTQHINPISSLAGRSIVSGPDLWLYFHGINTTERKQDLQRFYEEMDLSVLKKYAVDYIFLSSYERSAYEVNEEALDKGFPIVYEQGSVKIYRVDEP